MLSACGRSCTFGINSGKFSSSFDASTIFPPPIEQAKTRAAKSRDAFLHVVALSGHEVQTPVSSRAVFAAHIHQPQVIFRRGYHIISKCLRASSASGTMPTRTTSLRTASGRSSPSRISRRTSKESRRTVCSICSPSGTHRSFILICIGSLCRRRETRQLPAVKRAPNPYETAPPEPALPSGSTFIASAIAPSPPSQKSHIPSSEWRSTFTRRFVNFRKVCAPLITSDRPTHSRRR